LSCRRHDAGDSFNEPLELPHDAGMRGFAGRYSRAVEGISHSVLSERLSAVCEAGLASRTVAEGPPISVAYELTDAGRALLPALDQIGRWGEEHLPATDRRT
jgi:DNA-binding HxlR family transcriptional regulator